MITEEMIKLKEYLKENNIKGLALDIDDTICDTASHWFEEAVKEFGNPTNLTTAEIINTYGLIQNIPFWNKNLIEPWIINARFKEDIHFNVKPLMDSIKTIKKIEKIVPIVVYITARENILKKITKDWIDKYDFPKVPIIHVLNEKKDIASKISSKAKAEILEFLFPEVIGIVDDHPTVAELTHDNYQGNIYVFRSKETYIQKNIISCKNWEDVYLKIKNGNTQRN